jgi:hypothetical protein
MKGRFAMRIFVAAILLIHGLITTMQSQTGFKPSAGTANPVWLNWWPVNLGQSWILEHFGLAKSIASTLAGVLWIGAGICLIASALGLFGFIVPTNLWRLLAGIGAILSLALFIFYAHPLYAIGIGANLAIVLVLLWAKWPTPEMLGS